VIGAGQFHPWAGHCATKTVDQGRCRSSATCGQVPIAPLENNITVQPRHIPTCGGRCRRATFSSLSFCHNTEPLLFLQLCRHRPPGARNCRNSTAHDQQGHTDCVPGNADSSAGAGDTLRVEVAGYGPYFSVSRRHAVSLPSRRQTHHTISLMTSKSFHELPPGCIEPRHC